MSEQPMIEAFPDEEGRDGWLVTVPFSQDFVDDFKQHVPACDRSWDHASKRWWCTSGHRDVLDWLLLKHFDGYDEVDEDGVVTWREWS